jgi:hypothetical protein
MAIMVARRTVSVGRGRVGLVVLGHGGTVAVSLSDIMVMMR